ncbi:hypothetical protein STEG23_005322, partial [Scotinomys teguina]
MAMETGSDPLFIVKGKSSGLQFYISIFLDPSEVIPIGYTGHTSIHTQKCGVLPPLGYCESYCDEYRQGQKHRNRGVAGARIQVQSQSLTQKSKGAVGFRQTIIYTLLFALCRAVGFRQTIIYTLQSSVLCTNTSGICSYVGSSVDLALTRCRSKQPDTFPEQQETPPLCTPQ